ncbi:hypothetical protein TNCT_513021 [Trichonephila clavata]|uniref:Uncharacterized protein n=1 Tax=Trichonephila clavata TaxID=2740835 RepID=A0A8X6EWB8_TRICU|nr:hypothetical protein TNCT_513021 [Trichonephila clavata]
MLCEEFSNSVMALLFAVSCIATPVIQKLQTYVLVLKCKRSLKKGGLIYPRLDRKLFYLLRAGLAKCLEETIIEIFLQPIIHFSSFLKL